MEILDKRCIVNLYMSYVLLSNMYLSIFHTMLDGYYSIISGTFITNWGEIPEIREQTKKSESGSIRGLDKSMEFPFPIQRKEVLLTFQTLMYK